MKFLSRLIVVLAMVSLNTASLALEKTTYRTRDGRSWIRLVSSDELEYRHDGTTLLCKYSVQNASLRVILTVLGTQQVLYFKRTLDGYTAEDGESYMTPAALADLQRRERAAREAQQRAQQADAARRAEAERASREAAQKEAEAAQRRAAAEMERQRAVEAQTYGIHRLGTNGCTTDLYLKGSWSDNPIGGKVDFVNIHTGQVVFTDWPGKSGGSMLSADYYRMCRSPGSEATSVEIKR